MESKTIFDFLHFSHPTEEQGKVLKAMEVFIDEKDEKMIIRKNFMFFK